MNYTPQLVRQTCSSFSSSSSSLSSSSPVLISSQSISLFILSYNISSIINFCYSSIDLNTNLFTSFISFSSIYDEAGFLFLSHSIDFGSGYRYYLHKYRNGKGAWLTIRDGLIKLGNYNKLGQINILKNLSLNDIEELFDLNYYELKDLAKFIYEDIIEIATVLESHGYDTLGQFIQSNLHLGACGLVNLFVEYFPLTFRDEYYINETRVCLFKKAQLVVSEIYLRFSSTYTEFKFDDINELTAFVDNVVVAMLRKYEILQCTPELNEKIDNQIFLEKGSLEEVSLRACGVTAVEMIVQQFNEKQQQEGRDERVNSQLVCNWLWGCLGKEGENRQYPRHLTPSTSFY